MLSQSSEFLWLSVRLRDGVVLAEFPDLQVSSLEYRLEEECSASAILPYANLPSNWVEATTPFEVAILLVVDGLPLWGGIVLTRERAIRNGYMTLSLATVEHYLDSVYVTSQTYSGISQTEIMRGLIDNGLEGHDFNYRVEVSSSSTTRDRTYEDTDDNTILHYMQNLSNVIGGPEFCSMWESDGSGGYRPVFVIADTLGGGEFLIDETVMTSFTLTEDYTTGYGANRVMATGESEDEDSERPDSGWLEYSDPVRPVIEYKYQPGSSIRLESTLKEYAAQTLNNIHDGTTQVSISLNLLSAPLVWYDWVPGDYIRWNISEDRDEYPDYYEGGGRVVGYSLSFDGSWSLTPTLQEETTVVSSGDLEDDEEE